MTTPGAIQNGVLFGHDGELYLAHGGHAVLDYATGRRSVPPDMFAVFEANILARAGRCAAFGATYLHVIFPDKQSVVRERFPFPDPVCLGLLYEQHCPGVAAHLLNLTAPLREHALDVFKPLDTHLNDHGMALAASVIYHALTGEDHAAALAALHARPTKIQDAPGDLGGKLVPPRSGTERSIVADWPLHFFSNGIGFGNDGLADLYISPRSLRPARLLWFGDSFGRGCVRLLSLFFREIVFLRTRFFHEEMLAQLRPDCVVTQNAERYLDVVASDEGALPFLLYPALKGIAQAPTPAFARALAALLSYPRAPYWAFTAEFAPAVKA